MNPAMRSSQKPISSSGSTAVPLLFYDDHHDVFFAQFRGHTDRGAFGHIGM